MSVQIEEVALHAANEWFDGAQNRSDIRADVGSYYEGYLAAVLEERRRVWDEISKIIEPHRIGAEAGGKTSGSILSALLLARLVACPDGEPKEVNPPAGERRGDE